MTPDEQEQARIEVTEQFANTPLMRQATADTCVALFTRKLELCCVRFSFTDPTTHAQGKELKRTTLLELVDFVHTDEGQGVLALGDVVASAMKMVTANVFRPPPTVDDGYDAEEDDPVFEPSWPHLQVVYEFLLRVVVSRQVVVRVAKKEGRIDQELCMRLVRLFDSCDLRERNYLKTILHRIYGKFMSHRSFIRKQIANVFLRFAHETQRHSGIAELLEIFGSIINGFALPLKREHQVFLTNVLLPLHKARSVGTYHQQLTYCVTQYVEKDVAMIPPIVQALLMYWPWAHSAKQILFLNELEEVLDYTVPAQYAEFRPALVNVLARCIRCDHFQVVERVLFLWNNEHLLANFLSQHESQHVLPATYEGLMHNAQDHWNATVRAVAQAIVSLYQTENPALWEQVAQQCEEEKRVKTLRDADNERVWLLLEKHVAAMPQPQT